jgi:SAM-dependent methyltransferase
LAQPCICWGLTAPLPDMTKIPIINPANGKILFRNEGVWSDEDGNTFPVIENVLRIAGLDNYTHSFGFQWNKFQKSQIDREYDSFEHSRERFFAETGWDNEDLNDKAVLEVGSGAGRFSRVVLSHTNATLHSIDYSDAVAANWRNNSEISPERFFLSQASVYEMPFPDNSFDKVFCFGVLQHTPDFEASVKALIDKAKPGGEIIVDFYPIKGWWTKLNAKYFLRPFTKRMRHDKLLAMIEANIDWLIQVSLGLRKVGLGVLTRFLPVCELNGIFSKSEAEFRDLIILDTFDQYSPEHDHPQRIKDVAKMFRKFGARVTFEGFIPYSGTCMAPVVKGVKN